MDLTFLYTRQEWVNARKKYLVISKTVTSLQVASMAIFAIAIGVMIGILGLNLLAIISVGVICAYSLVLALIFLWQPGKLYDSHYELQKEYSLHFLPDKVIVENNNEVKTYSWNHFLSYAVTEDYFYLIQSKQSYLLIPKRVFDSLEQISKFENLVQDILPNAIKNN